MALRSEPGRVGTAPTSDRRHGEDDREEAQGWISDTKQDYAEVRKCNNDILLNDTTQT